MVAPQKFKNRTAIWSNNHTSGYLSKKLKSEFQRDICTLMLIAALFTTVKIQKLSKYSLLDEWCWMRSSWGSDHQLTRELDLGNQTSLTPYPVLRMCASLAFPALEAAQAHSLEIVIWCRDYLDYIRDFTQWSPLYKLFKLRGRGARRSTHLGSCPRQATCVSSFAS